MPVFPRFGNAHTHKAAEHLAKVQTCDFCFIDPWTHPPDLVFSDRSRRQGPWPVWRPFIALPGSSFDKKERCLSHIDSERETWKTPSSEWIRSGARSGSANEHARA